MEDEFNAFQELSTCRDGFAGGPLPWWAIDSFARQAGYEEEDRDRFFLLMRRMDEAWLDYQKSKEASEKRANKLKRGGGADG